MMVENTLIRREKTKQEKNVSLTEISFRKFKKNKLAKQLKTSVPNELKGQLLDELRNS